MSTHGVDRGSYESEKYVSCNLSQYNSTYLQQRFEPQFTSRGANGRHPGARGARTHIRTHTQTLFLNMVGSAKLKKSSIKVVERVDSKNNSNKRKKTRSTTDSTGTAVPAKAQHAGQGSRVTPDTSPNDNTMPDHHARRDTNHERAQH